MNKYKNYKNYIYVTLFVLTSCSEDNHEAYGSDGTPPGKVIINSVVNKPGGAVINFTPPSDEDLLYVSGKYKNEKNIEKEVIVSGYIDSLNIDGFGKTGSFQVKVSAYDLGNNESEAENVTITPLESPIHAILESFQGEQDFGGINIKYKNLFNRLNFCFSWNWNSIPSIFIWINKGSRIPI